MIFNYNWELLSTTADMIKFISFTWLKAELNVPDEIFNLWQINLVGSTMLHSKHDIYQDLVWWNAEIQAFSDGSLKFNNPTHKVGIGGYIMDRD